MSEGEEPPEVPPEGEEPADGEAPPGGEAQVEEEPVDPFAQLKVVFDQFNKLNQPKVTEISISCIIDWFIQAIIVNGDTLTIGETGEFYKKYISDKEKQTLNPDELKAFLDHVCDQKGFDKGEMLNRLQNAGVPWAVRYKPVKAESKKK